MTKAEANEVGKKIFEEYCAEQDRIIREAKDDGRWIESGLDSNRELFEELNQKTKERLAKLNAMIDE